LFDAVDLAPSFDLDGDRSSIGVAAKQIDRTDIGKVLTLDETEIIGDRSGIGGEEFLQMGFDPIFLKAWILTEFVGGIVMNLSESDGEDLALGIGDDPSPLFFRNAIGGIHPVEWLIGATVRVNRHATIGLHHDEASCQRKVSRESAGIVDRTRGDDETHEDVIVGARL